MNTRNLILVALVAASAMTATTAHAAITVHGSTTAYQSTDQDWLTHTSNDVDATAGLGTDGYIFFGDFQNTQQSGQAFTQNINVQPTYVSSFSASQAGVFVADGFANYGQIDSPVIGDGTNRIGGTVLINAGSPGDDLDLIDFTVSGLAANTIARVGVLSGIEGGDGRWDPTSITLTEGGNSATVGQHGVSNLPANPGGTNTGWVFFDIDADGDYVVSGTKRALGGDSRGPGVGGLTFDTRTTGFYSGEAISVDFGPTAPTTPTVGDHWNQFDYDGTAGNTTVTNLGRLKDGLDTGVSITVTSIENDTLTYLNGSAFGGSSDSTIFADGIHSTGSGDDNLFITISGLNPSLFYDLFGGSLRGGNDFGANWTITGASITNVSAPGLGNSFASASGIAPDASGVILIQINDPNNGGSPANNRNVGLSELTIVAVPTPAALPAGLALLGLVAMRRRRVK